MYLSTDKILFNIKYSKIITHNPTYLVATEQPLQKYDAARTDEPLAVYKTHKKHTSGAILTYTNL